MRIIILLLVLCSSLATAQTSTYPPLDSLVKAYANLQEFSGTVLVAQKGKILLQKGYGYSDLTRGKLNTVNTVYGIASITKTFTSVMIMKLAELRQLSLSDHVSKYFPDILIGDQITIENLLSHTSGVDDRAIEEAKKVDQEKLTREEKLVSDINSTPLASKPGIKFSYSNRGYFLLGNIIAKITKMPYEQAIRKYIFTPLGMNHSGFDFAHSDEPDKAKGYYAEKEKDYNKETPLMDSAKTFSAGAIYSTVGDLYKWHQALQHYKLISKPSLDMAYMPINNKYGYGWMTDSLYGKRIVSHSGGFWGFRSNFARITDDDICVVMLSNNEVPGLNMITKNLLAILYHRPYKLPVKKIAVQIAENILKQYPGTYEITEPHLILEVKLEEENLVVYPFGGSKSELRAADNSHFFAVDEFGLEISFERKGSEEFMIINMNGNIRVAKKKP